MVSKLEEAAGLTYIIVADAAFALNSYSIIDSIGSWAYLPLAIGGVITTYGYFCKKGIKENIDHTVAYALGTTALTALSFARATIGSAADIADLMLTTTMLAGDWIRNTANYGLDEFYSRTLPNFGDARPYEERMTEMYEPIKKRYERIAKNFGPRWLNIAKENPAGEVKPDGFINELAMWLTTNAANACITLKAVFSKEEIVPLQHRVREISYLNISY